LTVWVITGDGDALSIGGNHLLHIIRRNVNVNIVMFNNRIYGLTKGQYSPTSLLTHVSKSTPMGSIDYPLNPLSVAIAAEATFVARSVDFHIQHLGQTLLRAAKHRGTSFVEVYQNCNVFNDNAWEYMTDKKVKDDNMLVLQHGQPMIFGKSRDKGIRMRDAQPEVVALGNGVTESDILVHDEQAPDATLAYMLSRMRHPQFPEPVGVFRSIARPTYDDLLGEQLERAQQARGRGDLEALFHSGDTWTVA
jgi:2-oxoglutarate ferredoxin oxidoreductase subunit beta